MNKNSKLEGLTIAQIKSEYPNGAYKTGMKKADIAAAALATEKKPASSSASRNAER